MTPLFQKLNLKDQQELLIVNAPESFEPELAALEGVTVVREPAQLEAIHFLLAFVQRLDQIEAMVPYLKEKARGDELIWFAYPKGSSKKYTCEFNRDTGWQALGNIGYEGVRQVAIDADWSALRFRRAEFIKTMTRDAKRRMTRE
jgi:hypothetical protein